MHIMHTRTFGAVFRGFSPTSADVGKNVGLIANAVERAYKLEIAGKRLFKRIDIVVPVNPSYDGVDCGETAAALSQELEQRLRDDKSFGQVIQMHESEMDLFVGCLNETMLRQMQKGINYSFIISHGVADYIVPENFEPMIEAFDKGLLVTCLKIEGPGDFPELTGAGRIANTCAGWHNETLFLAGGFDVRAAKRRLDSDFRITVRGQNDQGNLVEYDLSGVEEIIPLVKIGKRLMNSREKKFSPFIAPVNPVIKGEWVLPSGEKAVRDHEAKMATKRTRQNAWHYLEGVDETFLQGCVAPEYKNQQ